MPVATGDLRFEVGARHLPPLAVSLVHITVVAILHDPVDPHAAVAVVVVVALPQRAKRIDRYFVIVAEVVAEHLEVTPVGAAAKRHSLTVWLARVVHGIASKINHGLAVFIVYRVTGVSEVKIPTPVGANRKRMHRMVVLRLACFCEQRFLAIGHEVAVVVVKNKDIRCT